MISLKTTRKEKVTKQLKKKKFEIKTSQLIYLSIRRSEQVREEVDDSASVDVNVKKIKGEKNPKRQENRKELLRIINNFLKFNR